MQLRCKQRAEMHTRTAAQAAHGPGCIYSKPNSGLNFAHTHFSGILKCYDCMYLCFSSKFMIYVIKTKYKVYHKINNFCNNTNE